MELQMGANAQVSDGMISINIDLPSGADIDITALQIYSNGKVRGDGDMCFYNQPSISGGAVQLDRSTKSNAKISIHFEKIPADVEKIVFTGTIDGNQTFGNLQGNLVLSFSNIILNIPVQGRSENALILAEIYKRNNQWKIRNVSQGFNGGLEALAKHFGVEIAEKNNTPPASNSSSGSDSQTGNPINLQKIVLTKHESNISLKKPDNLFGKIRINLNWNQKPQKTSFLGWNSSGIDLDLGAFIESKDGNREVVQALGNNFGDFHAYPYLRLLGDDRTGSVSEGEWIEINGDHWSEIRRILIYAFIYSGVPNWDATDGVVRIFAPGQPELEVRMNEYGSKYGMCAIANIVNVNNEIHVSREVTFHKGHKQIDKAYKWGFRWVAGSK